MPTYEFNCEKCANVFSLILSIREFEKEKERIRCPKCKSKRVKQAFSSFIAKTGATRAPLIEERTPTLSGRYGAVEPFPFEGGLEAAIVGYACCFCHVS